MYENEYFEMNLEENEDWNVEEEKDYMENIFVENDYDMFLENTININNFMVDLWTD